MFGAAITTADGRRVFVRDIGTQHVLEDLGIVPTLAQCLAETPCQPWMAGAHRLIRAGATIAAGSAPVLPLPAAPVIETKS